MLKIAEVFELAMVQNIFAVFALASLTHLIRSQNLCLDYQKDYNGRDISYIGTGSAQDCQKMCQANNDCNFWTWGMENHPDKHVQKICYLKTSKTSVTKNNFTISGKKICNEGTISHIFILLFSFF